MFQGQYNKHNSFTFGTWNQNDPYIPGGETEAQGGDQLPGDLLAEVADSAGGC